MFYLTLTWQLFGELCIRGERLHLADRNGVELHQSIGSAEVHVNEFSVHRLYIGENEELLDGRIVTDIAFKFWVFLTPFFGGATEQGDVEQVGFIGVGCGGLRFGDFGRNQMGFDRIGMDTVIDFTEATLD